VLVALLDAAPQSIGELEYTGRIGGWITGMAVQGSYAYIGEGSGLTILDISNPASPTTVGRTSPMPGILEDVAVSGDYAYVADGDGGLRVVDVSDPANPVEVGLG
jgi:hypothetical protein